MLPSSCTALVLNADFAPIRIHPLSVWPFERTMRAVLKDRVIVLEEHDVIFRSANLDYRPPSVVALKRYIKMPEKVSLTRMNIFLRDGCRCQYCGDEFSTRDLTFDHVIPRSKGGGTSWENIVSACMPCNSRKGSDIMKPLVEPRQPSQRDLVKKANLSKTTLHKSWLDYLYWSGTLQSD